MLTSKKKLAKVAAIIEEYLPLIKQAEEPPMMVKQGASNGQVVYETGLNILVNNTPVKAMLNKQKKFQNAKMVRSAKYLTKDFEDFGLVAYADFFERTLDKIASLNGPSKLAPRKEEIIATIQNDIDDFAMHVDAFYCNLMTDIFNVGRQHQEVAGLKKEGHMNIKKYMVQTAAEKDKFLKLNEMMQSEMSFLLIALDDELIRAVDEKFNKVSYKDAIITQLAKIYSQYSYKIEDIYRKHCWRTYQCGNLHQLMRDGVQKVAWKTGHHIDDCNHCRAFETGENILRDMHGNLLQYHRDIDTVRYNLKDIVALSEYNSPLVFCHDDCRCFFVNADK
jgi:hypothetical protein